MTTTSTTAPVAQPTWYGQIRDMFTPVDRAHMARQGLDLASYDAVMKHAGDIYQQVAGGNMPPNRPWPADWVGTFLNWMNNGYPKGVPAASANAADFAARSLFSADASTARVRKDITTLSSAELDLLKQAFSAIMAMAPTDPNSYMGRLSLLGWAANRDCLIRGLAHGLFCIVSCWAWMVVPLVSGSWHIPMMLLAGAILLAERLIAAKTPRWN